MITRSRFEDLKAKWGEYASWAVWALPEPGRPVKAGVGDLAVLDPDVNPHLLASLNPNIVLVGLNAASRAMASGDAWVNFHDPRSVANDFKLRFALKDTTYWGAYMTDVFIGLHETDSSKVAKWMKENPLLVDEHLERLRKELTDLGVDNPLLVALGVRVYEILQARLGHEFRIVKVTHYAHQISKENYREEVLRVLNNVRIGVLG